MHKTRIPIQRVRRFDPDEGFKFVRCRICGDHRRVLSARHLSKHGIDRDSYMEEFGLSPDELVAREFRLIQSSRKGYEPHGRKDWLAAIKNVYKKDKNVFAGHLQEKYPHLYNQGTWLFGDWDQALRAAGFDPQRMRQRKFWDEQEIIREIRAIRNQELPLYAFYAMKNHADVFSQALRHYGTWTEALVAAGIIKKHGSWKLYKSRLAVLRALRDALETNSKGGIPQDLKLQAEHYFGSLRKALAALKKDERLQLGWSKLKIITILSRMHRSKDSLAHRRVRRALPALLSAAEAYFGSWGKALHASGIDPNLYFVRHTWRRPRVKEIS